MLNAIPIVGWALSIFFSASAAVPFWFLWTYCSLGRKYFGFMPEVWLSIGFWDCVGVFVILSIIRAVLPTLSSSSSSSEIKK